jgi:hypothetical protein
LFSVYWSNCVLNMNVSDLERNGQIYAFGFKNVYIMIVMVENCMAKVGIKCQNA